MAKVLVFLIIAAGLAAACFGIATTHLQACSNGTLTLTGDKVLRNVVSIIDGYWKARYLHYNVWTTKTIAHCNSSMDCEVKLHVLQDGTRVLNSDKGNLTVEHSDESINANDHIQFLFEVHLTDGSDPHRHVFEVNFTAVCIRRRTDTDLNITRVLYNKLPWEQVIDMDFSDVNNTNFAYCNTGQCMVKTDIIAYYPSLNWINRFDITGGSLVLPVIQEDDRREIRVKVRGTGLNSKARSNIESTRVVTLWILVDTSQGSPLSRNETFNATSSKPSSFPTVLSTSLSKSLTVPVTHTPITSSGASAVHGPLWTLIVITAAATYLSIYI